MKKKNEFLNEVCFEIFHYYIIFLPSGGGGSYLLSEGDPPLIQINLFNFMLLLHIWKPDFLLMTLNLLWGDFNDFNLSFLSRPGGEARHRGWAFHLSVRMLSSREKFSVKVFDVCLKHF